MTRRAIVLGDGRRMPLGAYVRAWRTILAMPPSTPLAGSPCDPREPCTAARALAELRTGLHDRINRHLPGYGRGRKWDPDWYWQAWRMARDVNTPRLVVRWAPAELRARLAHRLTTD